MRRSHPPRSTCCRARRARGLPSGRTACQYGDVAGGAVMSTSRVHDLIRYRTSVGAAHRPAQTAQQT
eukprot:1904208-Prymnesium_polylepis.2